jgi:hypothetical protein
MALDPYLIYAKLHAEIPNLSLNMLYAIIGAAGNESHRVSRRLFGLSQTNTACSL